MQYHTHFIHALRSVVCFFVKFAYADAKPSVIIKDIPPQTTMGNVPTVLFAMAWT